jgi:hypothetical protein
MQNCLSNYFLCNLNVKNIATKVIKIKVSESNFRKLLYEKYFFQSNFSKKMPNFVAQNS